jgi:hypothetical protein
MSRSARPAGRVILAALAAVTLATAGTAGWAAAPRSGQVVLFDPAGSTPTARHCLTRIREELAAGGFEVLLLDPGPDLDPTSLAAAMERQRGAVAIIALVGDPDQPRSELWILDRVSADPEIRRIAVPADDPEHLPEVLAIRTIEVLNASGLKLLAEPTPPAPPPPPPPAPAAVVTAPPAPVPPPSAAAPGARSMGPFGLEAGLFLFQNVGGPGPAAVPLLRARVTLGKLLFTRITLAGLGSRPRVDSLTGSASVGQNVGLAELGVALRPGRRWRPAFTLGGGAFYIDSEGNGILPFQGLRQARWMGALDAGLGISAGLGSTVSLAFEVHGLLALPHPTVRFDEVEAATIGFPALLASLTMIAWL